MQLAIAAILSHLCLSNGSQTTNRILCAVDAAKVDGSSEIEYIRHYLKRFVRAKGTKRFTVWNEFASICSLNSTAMVTSA